jgi:hypothetical protein
MGNILQWYSPPQEGRLWSTAPLVKAKEKSKVYLKPDSHFSATKYPNTNKEIVAMECGPLDPGKD